MTGRETEGRFVSGTVSRFIGRYGYASILRRVREEGAGTTVAKAVFVPVRWCGWARSWLAGQVFDRRHGLRTSGYIPRDGLAMDDLSVEDGHSYLPTPTNVLPDVLSRLDIDYRDFTFVDLGSGKGAAILAAAGLNFRRIVGVEFNRDLHAVSVENVREYRRRRSVHGDIEILNMDVREFDFPELAMVVYIFNPFGPDVLKDVIERLAESYSAAPRKIICIYLNATRKVNPRAVIARFGFMTEVRVFGFLEMARFYSKCPFPVAVWTTPEEGAALSRPASRARRRRGSRPR